MKKIIIAAAALILTGTAGTASPASQQPETVPAVRQAAPTQTATQKDLKLDDQKQKDLDKLKRDEESKAQKAKDNAQQDYQAEIDKSTKAADAAMQKKNSEIDQKKAENIKKGEASIEKKYEGKHAKAAASGAKTGKVPAPETVPAN